MKTDNYYARVERIVAKDRITQTNIAALEGSGTDHVTAHNIHQWLVNAALRRHRKAAAEAHGHFNNGLTVGLTTVRGKVTLRRNR